MTLSGIRYTETPRAPVTRWTSREGLKQKRSGEEQTLLQLMYALRVRVLRTRPLLLKSGSSGVGARRLRRRSLRRPPASVCKPASNAKWLHLKRAPPESEANVVFRRQPPPPSESIRSCVFRPRSTKRKQHLNRLPRTICAEIRYHAAGDCSLGNTLTD